MSLFFWPPNIFFSDWRVGWIRPPGEIWAISVVGNIFEKIHKVDNRSTHTNFPPTHFQPTPRGGENFLARFYTFMNFSKMFLTTEIARISPRGLIWPTLQSEKKNIWGSVKKGSFLIFRPLMFLIISIDSYIKKQSFKGRTKRATSCWFWS